jgi:hypothetical protein
MRILIAVLMIVFAGCATEYATDAELKEVAGPWDDCVWNAVSRLDDSKLDPVSIAYGIEPICAAQYEHIIQTALKGMTSIEAQSSVRHMYQDGEIKQITSAILIYRKSHPTK